MDIEKLLNGTEFENLIPKFHEEGIANLNDLRIIHKNGKMGDLVTKITSTPTGAIKLKNLIESGFTKANRLIFGGLIVIDVNLVLVFSSS